MTKKHPFDHNFRGDNLWRPCVGGMRLVQFAVGIAVVGLLPCNPAMADIVNGTVAGGSALTAGGTFVS